MSRAFVGISGYDYRGWKDALYPPGVRRRSWLAFATRAKDRTVPLAASSDLSLRGDATRRFHSLPSQGLSRGGTCRQGSRSPAAPRRPRSKPRARDYRHAFEVRHPSYFCDEFYDLLRRHNCGSVIADTAGKFSYAEQVTADFVYLRLHGSSALYASDYTDKELVAWAARVRDWTDRGRDAYVYFDNDAKVHAPYNAMQLADLLT